MHALSPLHIDTFTGRKPALGVASVLFAVGAVGMAVAPRYWVLLLGRVVTGLGVGAGLVIAPLYTGKRRFAADLTKRDVPTDTHRHRCLLCCW